MRESATKISFDMDELANISRCFGFAIEGGDLQGPVSSKQTTMINNKANRTLRHDCEQEQNRFLDFVTRIVVSIGGRIMSLVG